jgi:Asp-tRNA(Asn)/Glu-tRNA(Gln) amidotransferase A subunit family amidase
LISTTNSGPRYADWTATGTAAAVRARRVSALETVDAALDRVARLDPALRAFRETWPAEARERARAVDRAVGRGEQLPLAGVPIAVKAGTGPHQRERLEAAGCVALGATSVPDRRTGWQTYGATGRGATLNPLDPAWSPGGSSAGSAVAVAAGLVPLATGTDGAGSVRIPAAWCGVLGLKPTNGLLPSRDASGLNSPGSLTRSAADAAAWLTALTGRPYDATPPRASGARRTVAWSATLGFAATEDAVAATARAALDRLAEGGALTERASVTVRLRDPAAAWTALRSPGDAPVPDDGTAVAAWNRAQLTSVLNVVDVIATPTTPHPPHGHDGPGDRMNVALTWALNLTGHPAVSVPAGTTPQGEPVGLQLIARHGEEALLLGLAAVLTGEGAADAGLR